MKTLILFLLIPVFAGAQDKGRIYCAVLGCRVCPAEGYPLESFGVAMDTTKFGHPVNIVYGEDIAQIDNVPEATGKTFSLFQGFYIGAELQSRFASPHEATLNGFGQFKFGLAKDLTAGLKLSVPFGMSGVRYEVNLSKRVF